MTVSYYDGVREIIICKIECISVSICSMFTHRRRYEHLYVIFCIFFPLNQHAVLSYGLSVNFLQYTPNSVLILARQGAQLLFKNSQGHMK